MTMTPRDYARFDAYVGGLTLDVYAQPPDQGHMVWGTEAINVLARQVDVDPGARVLDVGCGQGQFRPYLIDLGYQWTGVVLGEDYQVCKAQGVDVHEADMTFLPFPDATFDFVFARHVLEHSPFPIITLMEWRRVSKGPLLLVAPSPDYWGFRGVNHYSVAPLPLLKWWLERAGWSVMDERFLTTDDTSFLNAWHAAFEGEGAKPADDAKPGFAIVEYRLLCDTAKEVRR